MNISLIGLGAIGASYLAQIQDRIPDATLRVIADGDRADRIEREGVVVNGHPHHFDVTRPGNQVKPADLLLFSVKENGLDEAIEQAAGQVDGHTIILSLLNGITSEQRIRNAYGSGPHILLSLAVAIDAVRHGREVTYTSLGHISFGEAHNEEPYSDAVRLVRDLFERAAIEYQIPEDMRRALWWKYMVNSGINQVSAVLEAPYGVFQREEAPARQLMLETMREVIAVANAAGVPLGEQDLTDWLAMLDRLGPRSRTSMAQDVAAHRPTEVGMFAGSLVPMGQKLGVPTPIARTLLALLRAKEDVWAAAPSAEAR
ncbi:MAG: ketopantoate reductase family protein [Microbacteriaceae bacterium]|jgi:2-dehydropantoate 2-reductase|nr:ketopantoate reductase family protein [Microbacteriaceae bacterium]